MLIKIRIGRQEKGKKEKKLRVRKFIPTLRHIILSREAALLRLHDIENIKWAFTMLEEFRNYGQVRWAGRVFRQRCLRGTRGKPIHVISLAEKLSFPFFFFFLIIQSIQSTPPLFTFLFTFHTPSDRFLFYIFSPSFSKIVSLDDFNRFSLFDSITRVPRF